MYAHGTRSLKEGHVNEIIIFLALYHSQFKSLLSLAEWDPLLNNSIHFSQTIVFRLEGHGVTAPLQLSADVHATGACLYYYWLH